MSAGILDAYGSLTTLGFVDMQGAVLPSGPMMRDISQPGVAGKAYQRFGYAGRPFKIQTVGAFTSAANAALAQILYAQYQTHNITLTDVHGNTWANLFVLNVQIVEVKKIASGVGTLAGRSHLVIADWEMESAAVVY
jgi:hypothetical protein